MRVTLINPPSLIGKYNYSAFTHPPLGLAYLAACLRQKNHIVRVVDAVGEGISRFTIYPGSKRFLVQGLSVTDILNRIPPETGLIGISCMFSHTWPLVRQLIRDIKNTFPDIPIIAGGEHPTVMYDTCLCQAPLDACVLGEGEATTVEIVEALEKGRPLSEVSGIALTDPGTGNVIQTAGREVIPDLDAIPPPAWDAIPWKAYKFYDGPVESTPISILASRGCPHDCAFCSAPAMWKSVWRKRTPENILHELTINFPAQQITDVLFRDISPFIDRDWIQNLCSVLHDNLPGIRWQMPVGGRPEIMDKTTAEMLVRSGCRHIQFAPESGSPDVLSAMNKRLDLKRFRNAVLNARDAGMRISALFIMGYPGETLNDIRSTYRLIRWLAKQGVDEIAISSFVLLPGTRVFADLVAGGAVKIDDDFFFQAAGATSFTPAISWNPNMGRYSLFLYKWLGLIQFYAIAVFLHPRKLIRTISNLIRGKQETKTDRVLAEIVTKFKRRFD